MAPSEKVRLSRCVKFYMAQISEQPSTAGNKKIARSPEFKGFLSYLAGTVPSAMKKTLKSACDSCEDALRIEKEARMAMKRVEPPSCNERNAKRVKVAHSMDEETTPIPRVPESDMMALVRIRKVMKAFGC